VAVEQANKLVLERQVVLVAVEQAVLAELLELRTQVAVAVVALMFQLKQVATAVQA
jgi:hypothetical protein